MSARTKNQRLAIDTAMAILRHTSFTQLDIRWMHDDTRSKIAAAVATRNETILARIAVAYPGLPIELEGGRRHGRTWALLMATEVVIQVIQDICGVNPIYVERDEVTWMFMGRTLCADDHTPVRANILTGLVVADAELVDLWATEDGRLAAVCCHHVASSTVDEVRKPDGLGSGNSNLREAARRYRIVAARMPI